MRHIKNFESSFVWIHRILDIAVPIAFLYTIATLYGVPWQDRYTVMGLLGGLSLVFFNQGTGVYRDWRGRSLFAGFKLLLQAWVLTWMFLVVLAFLLKDSASFSRGTVSLWAIMTPIGLYLYRLFIRLFLAYMRGNGWNIRKIAIIGADDLGERIANTLTNAAMLGYKPVAFYDDDEEKINTLVNGIPVLGTIEQLLHTKKIEDKYHEIYIALPLRAENRIREILNTLADSTIAVKFVPNLFSFELLHAHMTTIGGLPVFSMYDSPLNSAGSAILKRTEDIFLSILILILSSPVILALSIGIKLSSPGPILYKQKRVGWNGKTFTMLKFRTMPVDIEKDKVTWGGAKSKTNSKLCAYMRKTSLDELPQFINVLKGDMSIVGPRPERDIFVKEFRKKIPRYMQKHVVKAGITGWAQINGWRGDTSIEKRIEYDLYYIDNWSIWIDLKIIGITFIKGFINKNAY